MKWKKKPSSFNRPKGVEGGMRESKVSRELNKCIKKTKRYLESIESIKAKKNFLQSESLRL